jgi:hypothetical protein
MKETSFILSAQKDKFNFVQKLVLILGLMSIFSNLKAQDLCTQFGQINLTKPSIANGNSSNFGTSLTNEVLEISGTFTVSGHLSLKGARFE